MALIKESRYSLRKGSRKETCPKCGRIKCFKPFVDNTTGEVLHPLVGRCDHEQSCGYLYSPHDFFHDHPEMKSEGHQFEQSASAFRMMSYKEIEQKLPQQATFFPVSWAEKAIYRPSTFRSWIESLPFDSDRIQQVLAEYYVGGTKKDIIKDGINYGPASVFWMIDEQQRVHDAKMIAYTPDGHRVEGWGNSARSACKKSGHGPQLEWTEKVLFGLHLIPKYPDKAVCIVESEKSALVCACKYPDFVWTATGGCSNLQISKLKPLMNRKLIIYPDSGELTKWREQMAKSGHKDYRIVEELENYGPNTDIADVILGTAHILTF